jgi:prepilin-type N-terminal cleavage/methylation domain-containing protein
MIKKNGFTVVEMLVSLLLLAVLVAISFSVGRETIARADFTSTVNQFISDFSFARQLAARENRYAAITFDSEGTTYSVLLQREVAQDPASTASFTEMKKVEPMNGKQFIAKNTPGFMVNAMGITRKFPYDPANADPITVTVDFFRNDVTKVDVILFKKTLTIFPSGGIKIEDKMYH